MMITCPKCGATITLSPTEQINGCPMCGHGRRDVKVTSDTKKKTWDALPDAVWAWIR